jgi:hypothetical protein
MNDDWVREPTEPEEPRPMEEPRGIEHDDPQQGFVTRDAEDVPDAARPLHPDVGGTIGPS